MVKEYTVVVDGVRQSFKAAQDDLTPQEVAEVADKMFPADKKPATRESLISQIPGGNGPVAKPADDRSELSMMMDTVSSHVLPAIKDTPEAAWRTTKQVGNAIGQALLAPVSAFTGKENVYTGLAKQEEQAINKLDPGAQVLGGIAAQAVPGMAAARAAAPVLTMAQAAGPAARIAATAGLGGAVNAATTPATDPNKSFVEEKGDQFTMGSALAGAGATVGEGVRGGKNVIAKALFGDTENPASVSQTAKALWDKAKNLGFDLSPSSTSATASKVQQSGITASQRQANSKASAELVSEATGQKASTIDMGIPGEKKGFIERRLGDLGKEYDEIYKPGTKLKVDPSAIAELKIMVDDQVKRPSALMTKKALDIANRVVGEYDLAVAHAGAGTNVRMKLNAEDVQLLRNELSSSKASSSNAIDRKDLGDVISAIDASVERNHPDLAAKLKILNPQYRATKTLAQLREQGGIDSAGNISLERLGSLLRGRGELDAGNHPLQLAGKIGETFGIRSPSQPAVVAGVGNATSGAEIALTKAGAGRLALQYAERLPPLRKLHEANLRGMPKGLSEDEMADLSRWAGQAQLRDPNENKLP